MLYSSFQPFSFYFKQHHLISNSTILLIKEFFLILFSLLLLLFSTKFFNLQHHQVMIISLIFLLHFGLHFYLNPFCCCLQFQVFLSRLLKNHILFLNYYNFIPEFCINLCIFCILLLILCIHPNLQLFCLKLHLIIAKQQLN